MTTFDRDSKDTLIQRIITTALWFTDTTDKLTNALIAFDAYFDQPVDQRKYTELFIGDDQIQQLRRVAQYADDRFQTALAVYCQRFNDGNEDGVIRFQGQGFAFWKQDGKFNMILSETPSETKIIDFSGSVQ